MDTDDDRQHRAVLFDMDGVLVDSERYWHEAQPERIFPATLAGEYPDLDETTGMNYREIYDYLDENYETKIGKKEFISIFEQTAREIYRERVSLLDGFHDLRAALAENDIAVAIVTSAPTAWHEIVTERFDITVDETISAEDIDGPGKPAPAVYKHAARVIGVDPAACLVVEDSKNGVDAGKQAGMTVIAYRSGPNDETDLSAADVVVTGAEELRAKIQRRTGINTEIR
ncbi:MAG: haloacid dehalogenase superfamily, subfamily IA, variant 3 with third motif having DD or ED [Halonotius sp. J07HN4]|nr:MAG: haloacid dehalogenase superfamily, subfamily IA, variant 3 with third motif having DD or ED [Halonotius sp. J07HN4]